MQQHNDDNNNNNNQKLTPVSLRSKFLSLVKDQKKFNEIWSSSNDPFEEKGNRYAILANNVEVSLSGSLHVVFLDRFANLTRTQHSSELTHAGDECRKYAGTCPEAR